MRCTDGIKDVILHSNPAVWDWAVSDFARSSRPDPTIMPPVIRAVENISPDPVQGSASGRLPRIGS